MLQTTENRYIVRNDEILHGEPVIKGTRTPVRAIVEIWRQGVAVEEISSQLPHLNLAQVFDALGFYSEHQDEINKHIEENRIPAEWIDPIVEETRKLREQFAAEHGYDMDAIFNDIQKRQEQTTRKIVSFSPAKTGEYRMP